MPTTTKPKTKKAKPAFKRHRSLDELREKCRELKWQIDSYKHDEEGSDHVMVFWRHGKVRGSVLYSVFNGRFFGAIDKGGKLSDAWITSDETEHDAQPWFQALLSAFYIK